MGRTIGKWAAIALAVLAALLALYVMELTGRAHRALPDYDGKRTVEGPSAPVEIVRDAHAIPHIFAANKCDASFGLGYAHAQDRLWQMDIYRHAVQGRLAELFGPPAVEADRIIRTIGLYRAAEQALDALSPDVRACLDAYAAGVNAVIEDRERPLPPEFQILWHEPEPWQAADSVAAVKVLAAGLSGNAFGEILRARMIDALTPDQLEEFDSPYPADAKPAVRDLARLYRAVPWEQLFAGLPDMGPPGASNNWVVDGQWTASGKPLLANDPHLGMSAPSVWYAAHLSSPEIDAIGVTIAGIPSIILGHNQHIAWGYTNTGGDVQDLYLEMPAPDDPAMYLTPDGPRPFATREETIKVRFGADQTVTVRETRHGPVLDSSLLDGAAPEGQLIALRWAALNPGDTTIEAGMRILESKSVTDFNDAVRLHVAPMQNMVVADVDGHIGMIAPARVPLRGPDHATGGRLPAPGWEARNDWTGFVPHEGLPRVIDPPHGFIATANNKIVGDDFPYYITDSWDAPYRAMRIEEMIQTRRDHTVATFETMLADNVSLFARQLLPYLTAVEPAGGDMAEAIALLKDWDGTMDADLPQPAIFHAWLLNLNTRLYADELGDLAGSAGRRRETFIANALAGRGGADRWCDVTTTEATETCTDITRLALEDALADLDALTGEDLADIRWGALHPVVNSHLPFRFVPGLNGIFSIERESGGGPYTVNRGQYGGSGDRPFANVHAAGYRAIFDLADLENSVFVISTGQSGNPASPWWEDFATLWAGGGHIPMVTDRARIEAEAMAQLTLAPAP